MKEYEGGSAEVKSCHKIGETVTDRGVYPAEAEEGADRLDEVWTCTVTEQAVSVEKCYVIHDSKVKTIVRGVRCNDA